MRVYTIMATFSVGETYDYDECWVANYSNRKDAIKALRFKLKETGALNEDGTVPLENDNRTFRVYELFDFLLKNGCCYNQCVSDEVNRWFVRGEEIQEKYDKEKIRWD